MFQPISSSHSSAWERTSEYASSRLGKGEVSKSLTADSIAKRAPSIPCRPRAYSQAVKVSSPFNRVNRCLFTYFYTTIYSTSDSPASAYSILAIEYSMYALAAPSLRNH
ncbi:hypothetical protein QYF36_017572 [Acer negundo]|nr:hypothetical protein QYF36_017572 [Acer negundo]